MKTLKNRLRRIEGQIRGLQRLLEEAEDCETILVQFAAVKSALDKSYGIFLRESLIRCLSQKDTETLQRILQKILDLKSFS